MINQIYYAHAPATDPFVNQAWEKCLLEALRPNELLFYLWQNEHTVVIGRNQNPWRECDVTRLEAAGGRLARRLSGGGAVYHDLDNLNFTFLLRRDDYDLPRQQQVLLQALKRLGVAAELSGRNDIIVGGRKLSGNAFWQHGEQRLHHGTLLLAVDAEKMGRYLRPSGKKLAAKGVASAPARVAGLREFAPGLSVKQLAAALLEQLGQVYSVSPRAFDAKRVSLAQLAANQALFSVRSWRLAQPAAGNWYTEERFDWGELQLSLDIKQGQVSGAQVYTDALDADLAPRLSQALIGCVWDDLEPARRVSRAITDESMRRDVISLLQRRENND